MDESIGGFDPRFIVIHHSATDCSMGVEEIRNYHVSLGWKDIGYHKLIDAAGTVHDGRPLDQEGAHARGLNGRSFGVCCIGNFENEEPSGEMFDSLKSLITDLCRDYRILPSNILGHCETGSVLNIEITTKCPGNHLKKLLPALREAVGSSLSDPGIRV